MPEDPTIAFAQNLVNKFMQFKMMQLQEQRYGEQLRLDRERNRLYTRNIESLIATRRRPERGTKGRFLEMGYSEEEAQLGQDIAAGLAPKRMTPAQQLTAGKLMLDNAITIEGQQAGQQMMNDAMEAIKAQRQFPSSPKETSLLDTPVFPSGETEPISDTTEQPLFLQGMREAQPEDPFKSDPEFGADVLAAQKAMQEGRNPVEVYRRMRKKYPNKTEQELYKIYQF